MSGNNSIRFIGKSVVLTDSPDAENSSYNAQALEFCHKHNVVMLAQRVDKRGDMRTFGTRYYAISIVRVLNGEILTSGLWFSCGDYTPSCYDVLSCVAKYPVDEFGDFIEEFGFSIANKHEYEDVFVVWEATKQEYAEICRLFPEDHIMEELREIS